MKERIELLRKSTKLWYENLTPVGRGLMIGAIVGLIWLIFAIINGITGLVPFFSSGAGRIVAIVLNIVSIVLVTLIAVQIGATASMYSEAQKNYREAITRGKRGGNRAEQMTGRRNAGSIRRRSSQNVAARVAANVSEDTLNRSYPPKLFGRPTIVEEWKEIEEPGLYALKEAPRSKVEIMDASQIGGGYYVAFYEGRFVPSRNFVLHNQSGTPLNFSTMRAAKKQLGRGLTAPAAGRPARRRRASEIKSEETESVPWWKRPFSR